MKSGVMALHNKSFLLKHLVKVAAFSYYLIGSAFYLIFISLPFLYAVNHLIAV